MAYLHREQNHEGLLLVVLFVLMALPILMDLLLH